jgi:hypothetical protein
VVTCTAVDTPYAGCAVAACTAVDTPYAGCAVPTGYAMTSTGGTNNWPRGARVTGVIATAVDECKLESAAFDCPISQLTYGKIETYDTSAVTSTNQLFYDMASFDGDLSAWLVGAVVNINYMFCRCTAFASDVSLWQVGSVTSFDGTFNQASSFGSDVASWDVSAATAMYMMFIEAASFNCAGVANWNTAALTDAAYMSTVLVHNRHKSQTPQTQNKPLVVLPSLPRPMPRCCPGSWVPGLCRNTENLRAPWAQSSAKLRRL